MQDYGEYQACGGTRWDSQDRLIIEGESFECPYVKDTTVLKGPLDHLDIRDVLDQGQAFLEVKWH